jgi:hypothetical protein
LINDPNHSEDEARFILPGLSRSPRLLEVCHCRRSNDNVIRIISARKTNGGQIKVLPSKVTPMHKEYDFSQSRKNPYASQLKKQITIRLDEDAIA